MMFRTILLLSFCIVSAVKVYAQQAEPVYSFVKQKKSTEWYKAQALLWKQELGKHPDNALGWEYYFQANHNILSYAEDRKPLAAGMTDSLHGIVEKMGRAVPGSFEYNFDMYYYGSQQADRDKYFPYLIKAYNIDSTRWETYEDLATYAEMKYNKADRKKYMEKWYAANRMSPGFMNWSYNLLMSLADNAILFTAGDNDTYPVWMLQDVKNVRKDVMLINLSLFGEDEYRRIVCKKLGIPFLEIGSYNEASMGVMGKWIVEHVTTRPVYFSETTQPDYYKPFEDSMYLEGLALRYSPVKYDNVSVLRGNVENRFLMDYLKAGFTNDISEEIVASMNTNYIAPFITLYHYYNDKGDKVNAKHYKDMVMMIGTRADMKEEVEKYFSSEKK